RWATRPHGCAPSHTGSRASSCSCSPRRMRATTCSPKASAYSRCCSNRCPRAKRRGSPRVSAARRRTRGTAARSNATSKIRRMERLTILRPDDWHLHLRDGAALAAVVADSARRFARAIVMPNLKPPVTTTQQALHYRERILGALPDDAEFEPLMTLYLTDDT